MKTMKLLPLKIAVTSAMIVGLGAVSTANAQQQQSSSTPTTVEDFLPRLTQTLSNPQYQNEFEDALDQYHNMVVGDTAIVSTLDSGNNITGTALKFYSDAENTLPSSMLFDQIMTNQRLNGFKEGQPFIPVDDNGNPITQIDQVAGPNGTMQTVRSVTTKIATADDVAKSPYAQGIQKDIDDLYSFDQEVTDRIATLDRATEILTEAGNHHDTLIRKNKANIKTLAQAQLESVTFLGEQIQENKDDISAVTGKAFKNQIDIQKNNESIDDLYEANNENVERLVEHDRAIEILAEAGNHHDTLIRKNKADIQDLAAHNELQTEAIDALNKASSANTKRITTAELGIAENKKDALIAKAQADKNKNDIQDLAKAQLAGVEVMAELNKNIAGTQTDIANNKITLAQHAKKIDDNQQAIEAKLGGKADLQKLSELKTSVDKNQADIQLHDTKITNLGILHSMVARAVGANKTRIDQNQTDIAANKADADANFETLTKNQNALIEQDEAHDRLIAANKADADAKFTGVQTDIANNKTTLAQHAKKIDDNQQAIEAKLGGKADLQKLSELKTSVDKNQTDIATNKNAIDANKTAIDKNKADADAKFTGVQTDIANNKTTLAQHAKKINDNQQAIEAKLGGKADTQALNNLNDKVNGFDGRISALDTKVNAFDGRITALDSKVENGMAAQAALSGLFQPYSVGKFNATAALGGYGSKSAVAIGAGYRVNPNLAIKAGAAINTSGDKKGSYNIGVNYEF
ncbi:hypothetical protein AO366_1711 [Moraxella catarrhalis]|uniref:YadA-like family protein n=1 Tax=Moraxella catarrhalis TaxID=480 RepID=UPI0007E3D5F5|nr:YadA-like family protein [Moraxella catarrhalis]OAV30847.1 hypothetical protein AO366_1711 [Moraxella catarrhalis]